MKRVYRVSLWTSIEVEADNEDDASDKAFGLLPFQRRRNFDVETQELNQDGPQDQA